MITTLTLNPAVDLTLEINGLLVEDVNRVKCFYEDAGGKGINVSKILHKLGVKKLETLAVLGGKRSGNFKRIANADGLNIKPIPIFGETRINFTIYDKKTRKTTKLNEPGPVINPSESKKIWNTCLSTSRRSTYFVIAGSLLPNLSPDWYAQLIRAIQRKKLFTVLDADGDCLKKALSSRPFLIKPNRYEAERVLGRRLFREKDFWWAIERLQEKGAQNVLLSLGREGALFSGFNQKWRGYSFPVPAHSTIGAGDSLLAGFLYQIAKGKGPGEAIRFGIACGTHTAMKGSAKLNSKSEVDRLLSKIRIKKITG